MREGERERDEKTYKQNIYLIDKLLGEATNTGNEKRERGRERQRDRDGGRERENERGGERER
jgi:hypothetical protein